MHLISRTGMLLLTAVALSATAHGQRFEPSEAGGGPFSHVPVLNAPFSARAVTTVRELLSNGTVREQTVTATYYRDSQGRVRAELDNPWGTYIMLWTLDPQGRTLYAIDPVRRTYRLAGGFFARALFNGEGRVAVPVGKACFRTAPRIAGESAAERLEAVNAQVSEDLGVVIASHWSHPGTSVAYELTDIQRAEPPAELFEIPTSYTFVRGSTEDPLLEFDPWSAKHFCVPPTR